MLQGFILWGGGYIVAFECVNTVQNDCWTSFLLHLFIHLLVVIMVVVCVMPLSYQI